MLIENLIKSHTFYKKIYIGRYYHLLSIHCRMKASSLDVSEYNLSGPLWDDRGMFSQFTDEKVTCHLRELENQVLTNPNPVLYPLHYTDFHMGSYTSA